MLLDLNGGIVLSASAIYRELPGLSYGRALLGSSR
jgi:hypothetical protein